jgi:phage repressor protein C with HTH and peptisase S24 domain
MTKTANPSTAARLRALRERSGLSMAELAKGLGFRGASSYQRYEDPALFTKKYLPLDLTEKLVQAFSGRGKPPITETEIMALAQPGEMAGVRRVIPIVGYVGAGAEIYPIDDHPKGQGLDEVESPWPGLPPSTVAVRVRGDSMTPAYFDGDIIFYDEQHTDFLHLLGKECVVGLSDGRKFIKQLKRTADGHWYLYSHNMDPIFGVEILWVGKVRMIWRAD